jgi:Fe-S-cluster-containing dehydrogenase component
MRQYYFIIDVAKCWDCNNCFIACCDEHQGNDWPGYTLSQPGHGHRWMNVSRRERGQFPMIDVAYRPTPCMHCRYAPCVEASGGAISRRGDGIVLIDQSRAKGRKDLVSSCPYGAIFWNEEKDVPQKCTMCAHLLDSGWSKPRCVQACFTGALTVEKLEEHELARRVESEGLVQLPAGKSTGPNVYYRNLYRFDKVFIGGTVAATQDGVVDCVKGAEVSLLKGGDSCGGAATDSFGDFRFDGLAPRSGDYLVQVECAGYRPRAVEVKLGESVFLGTIMLEPDKV